MNTATISTHSPAPWKFRNTGQKWAVIDNHGGRVTLTVSREDARLISAAPELLATLRAIADEAKCYDDGPRPYSGDSYLPERFLGMIRATLAKAEGRR